MKVSAKLSFVNGITLVGDENSEYDFIVPAFIDIHCHGGGGKYFSEDANIALSAHCKFGTKVQFASLVSEEISILKRQVEYLKSQDIYGIHLEGPYLSQKFCGAHDPKLLKSPKITEIKEILAIGEGAIKFITIAPELDGAIEAIEYLSNHDVVVAIGHSDAKASDTKAAIAAGAKIVTHFNNGMAKIGVADSLSQVALESDIYLELIQDGHHVAKSDSFTVISKAANRIIAVTDAMAAAGCDDGEYRIGKLPVIVRDSVAKLSGTNTLAGSTLTMLDAFLNFIPLVGFEQAVAYTSLNPAKVFNINPFASYIGIKNREITYL